MRSQTRTISLLAGLAGVVLIILAVMYFTMTADALPSFIPGHEVGSSRHHVKHGIASLFLGLAAFAFVWFQTGPKSGSKSSSTE